ncbi:phenylacetate--CoA ligase family protein [Desulfobulbus elongatus]|uniref:phenylacetate--CoA ligase family protein n=1 Tax=Desulfobulbus elongatus TaxID=53332 RepID=UPI0004888656|nr:phenylacetate--CoA ligase family protein [Desulfobulbus elongatus]
MMRGLLLGYPYLRTRQLLRKTEFLPRERLADLQLSLLLAAMRHALLHIPIYTALSKGWSKLETLDPQEALHCFPFIDKQVIREHFASFYTGPSYRRLKATSGGSTGTPFVFYMDRYVTRQVEKAFIFDQWSRVGYRFGDSIFNLRGRTPPKGRFLYHDRLFNIHFASSFNLTAQTVGDYVNAINQLRPRFLHGYPSTMYQLAALMESKDRRLSFQPQAIFCGLEKTFPYQREKIESVFGCRVYHWYGHSEYLALGGACEYSDTLHFYPQYGYTELIASGVTDERGQELFEIVATGFNNPVMPLIRYRTGDYAVPAANQTCRCGRHYLLVDEVVGRQQEFIVDAHGSLISATSLIFGQHYAVFGGVESIRLHQKHPGKLDVILVKGVEFCEDSFREMQARMLDLIGDRMTIRFLFSDQVEKTPIGKARLVEQELDTREYFGR